MPDFRRLVEHGCGIRQGLRVYCLGTRPRVVEHVFDRLRRRLWQCGFGEFFAARTFARHELHDNSGMSASSFPLVYSATPTPSSSARCTAAEMPRDVVISRLRVVSEVQNAPAALRIASAAFRRAVVNAGDDTRDLRSFSPVGLSCADQQTRSTSFWPDRIREFTDAEPRSDRRLAAARCPWPRVAQDFREDGLQAIGPMLVRLGREMESVKGHAIAQLVIG
jgi:hypothetical protein